MNNKYENKNIIDEEALSIQDRKEDLSSASYPEEEGAPQEADIVSYDKEAAAAEGSATDEKSSQEKESSRASDSTYTPGFTVTHSKQNKSKPRWMRVVALSLAGGIVFGGAFGLSNEIVRKLAASKITIGTTNVTLNKAEKNDGDSSALPASDIAVIAQECMPSIVAITNRSVSDVMTFFGKYEQESTSSGSGIIIGKNDTELLIVTNYHVVANSKELSVLFSPVESRLEMQSGKEDAEEVSEDIPTAVVKGYDSSKDLAVIAVKLEDISPELLSEIKIATIGDSSSLKPGDQVVAIGNALGYGQSVTTGIISAVNRNITMENADGSAVVTNTFIQTDAAINQGNSGGALLDMNGNVIGINSVKIATTGVEGMGYAIPISDVESIIDELMVRRTRSVVDENKQGFLGITGYDVSSSVSQMYGIPAGVYVESAIDGLAAQKAGIKKGYIITKFDGYSITSIAQLQDRLQYYSEGEKVKVTVKIPDGTEYKEKEVEVALSNKSKNTD